MGLILPILGGIVLITLLGYVLHSPTVPRPVKILAYVALAIAVVVMIVLGIYTISSIVTHI